MSRLQHFLRSPFFPSKIIVLFFGIAFAAADFASGPARNESGSGLAPAVAMTHGGPTNTPTNTGSPTATATGTPVALAIHFTTSIYTEDESQVAVIPVYRLGTNIDFTNSVSVSTANGTGTGGASCSPGVDYISVTNRTLTFNPGEREKTVDITICADTLTEPDETVNLSLTGANVVPPSIAVLTINDTATAFRNSANIAINQGLAGSPYPSTITVSGGLTVIESMRVTIYDYATTNLDDVDLLLVGPTGQKFILMANAGGTNPVIVGTLNFTDNAGMVLPDNTFFFTGDYEPTSYGAVADFPASAPAGPYNEPGGTVGGTGTQTLFGNFGGINANGTWSLYLRDDHATPGAVIGNVAGGWGIEFTGSTPTPTNTPAITPTEPPPFGVVQFSSPTYFEDESQTAAITLTRTGNLSGIVTVTFTASNGTAFGGAACSIFDNPDFINVTAQQVIFNPNEASKTVDVALCGDALPGERDETVKLLLTGANVGSLSTAVLTINDTATQYENLSNIVINGGGAADPYPSTIIVTGNPGPIGSMRVTVYDYSTTIPIDVSFLLVSPGGRSFILMANAGGLTPGGPVTLNFADTAGQVLPFNGPLTTGDFEPTSYGLVANLPVPAPGGPYNLPGSVIGLTPEAPSLVSTFGGTNANGVWKLYVREQAPPPYAPSTVVGIIGGWGIDFIISTSAQGSISGRVMTADGHGIRNVEVVITGNSLAEPLVVTTGSFGHFSFEGLATGETYVVSVNSKRYTFSTPSRVIALADNVVDADFIAYP